MLLCIPCPPPAPYTWQGVIDEARLTERDFTSALNFTLALAGVRLRLALGGFGGIPGGAWEDGDT